MAVFNPNIPNTNDPNYLGYSQRPHQTEGSKQWEALFKGVGSVLDAGLKATDQVVRSIATDQVQSGVDTIRNAYTNTLERVAQVSPTQRVATDATASTGMVNSLLPGGQQVPDELADVGTFAANLRAAALSGNISKTHYEGTLARYAKSVRDKFPGWREHVDQEIAKATSASMPANQYIEGLIQDINKGLTSQKTEMEKVWSIVKENPGMPNATEMAMAVQNGQMTREQFYKSFQDYKGPIDRAQNQRVLLGLKEDLDKDDRTRVTQEFTTIAARIAANGVTSTQTIAGVETPNQIQTYINEVVAGRAGNDPAKLEAAQQSIKAAQLKAAQNIALELDKVDPNDPRKRSFRAIIGDEASNRITTNSIKIYDDIHAMIQNKEFGLAFSLGRVNQAMTDETKNRLFRNPNVGNFLQKLQVLGGMGPEVAERFIRASLSADIRLNRNLQDAFLADAVDVATGDGRSLRQVIGDASTRGINNGDYNRAVLNLSQVILDTKQAPKLRATIAAAAFKETGLIQALPTMDAKHEWFGKMASPQMAKEILALSQTKEGQGLWRQYKDWVEHTGAREMIPEELSNLQSIQDLKGVRIGWDSENSRIRIDTSMASGAGGAGSGRTTPRLIALAARTERRINQVLDSIKPVYAAEGINPDAFLAAVILDQGRLNPSRVQGLPEQILKAIQQSRQKANQPKGQPK